MSKTQYLGEDLRMLQAGRREDDIYNAEWCKQKHLYVDEKLTNLDNRMWSIFLLLVVNLGGIIGVFLTVLWTARGAIS